MTILYLIRHGETLLNRTGVFLGHTDCDLSDEGINQSKNLAKSLESVNIDIVLSSPLKRAYKTASYLANQKGLKVKSMEGLREMNFGLWDGLHYKDIARRYPKEWDDWGSNYINSSPVEGESFQHFYHRVSITINEILKLYKDKKIAVVTHDGFMKAATSILLKMGQEGFWNFYFEHGQFSIFEIQDDHCTIKKINCI